MTIRAKSSYSVPKTQFSEFPHELFCNQEYACGLEQGLDDEATSVVAQGQSLVLQKPGIGAFDWPTAAPQAGAAGLAPLVDVLHGAKAAAQHAAALGIVAAVGEHGPDPGHHGEGGQEQALEQHGVVDVGCGCRAGDRHAVPGDGDVVFCASLAAVGGLGPVRSPPRLARTEQLSMIKVGLPRIMATSMACTLGKVPVCAQRAKARRKVEPLAWASSARRLRHGVPSRRNRRRVASTRTTSDRGCSGPSPCGSSQHAITVAIMSKTGCPKPSPPPQTPEMGRDAEASQVGQSNPG